MNLSQIESIIQQEKEHPKTIFRLVMFVTFAGRNTQDLEAMQQCVMNTLSINEADYRRLLHQQYVHWHEKIEQIEEMIADSSWMKQFLSANSQKFSSSTLSASDASLLLSASLCLVLQQLSIQSYTFCVKKRYARVLLDLLQDPKTLKPAANWLCKPVLQMAKGRFTPVQEQFLLPDLAMVTCLACYLNAFLVDGNGARCQMMMQFMKQLQHWDLDQIREFLYPWKYSSRQEETLEIMETQYNEEKPWKYFKEHSSRWQQERQKAAEPETAGAQTPPSKKRSS